MAKLMEIPQEIIDDVIAAVGDDTHLLKQCSLVSSSFLRPSRKQLFSRISISSDQTCQGIHQLLVQNPAIQSFVKTITLMQLVGSIYPKWMNGTSLLDILRLPFCCLECFSIILLRDSDESDLDSNSLNWKFNSKSWGWNCFSSEMKDALSNIILSSTLKTLYLRGITHLPITLFHHIAHLTTLELDSLSPNDFCEKNSSSLTQTASKGVIDRVWRFGEEHAQTTESIFLPFMCRLRFLEIYLDLNHGSWHDFNILSFLMLSLSISLTSPEHLKFDIQFCGYNDFDSHIFYENLRNAWNHLDSITTHSTSSRLQRVDIIINYVFRYKFDNGVRPDKDGISKAVLDGLPLLCTKGILFVEAFLEE